MVLMELVLALLSIGFSLRGNRQPHSVSKNNG